MSNEKSFQNLLVDSPNVNKGDCLKKTKVSILLIEDNQIIQLVHQNILTRLGCQIDTVSSGEEALLVIDNHYDLILLDIGLPGISGIDVAIKFREHENHKKTRIVAITAHGDIANNCLAIEKVLNKPVNAEDLETIICQLEN